MSEPAQRLGSRMRIVTVLPLFVSMWLVSCGDDTEATPASSSGGPSASSPSDEGVEGSGGEESGLLVHHQSSGLESFHHRRYMTPDRKYLPETAGSGVALLDYDADGRLDVYAVQCAPLPGWPGEAELEPDRLFRNEGALKFRDVTEEAGLGDERYGMGATAPDLDGDGYPELYVTNLGDNVFYRNRGDGGFDERTSEARLHDEEWSTAAGWIDHDRDGDLDLYLCNYAELDFENYNVCQVQGLISYCHPEQLTATLDRFLRNDGGTFTDVSEELGVHTSGAGRGLAAVPMDHDDDGWIDLFIANDASKNFLWRNQEGQGFEDVAGYVGVDVSAEGKDQSCMGTDVGDVDGDGDFDIFSANFSLEYNVLYLKIDDYYDDCILQSGMGAASYENVGFGAELFDIDKDGDLDLLVVNGHIVDVVEQISTRERFLQEPQLFLGDGNGHFEEVGPQWDPFFTERNLGRGLATGDLDDDGDVDFVVSHNDAPLALLENRAFPEHHWIGLELIGGAGSPRDPIGARVHLRCGETTQVEEVRGSSSYLSWQDLRLFFGLGSLTQPCTAEIRWPSGEVQVVEELAVDRYHVVREGSGSEQQ